MIVEVIYIVCWCVWAALSTQFGLKTCSFNLMDNGAALYDDTDVLVGSNASKATTYGILFIVYVKCDCCRAVPCTHGDSVRTNVIFPDFAACRDVSVSCYRFCTKTS